MMKCAYCQHVSTRISQFGLALSLGITWALGVAIVGLLAMNYPPYATPFMNMLSSVYLGFGPTPKGIAVGAGWAVIDGFITGFIIALIYNICRTCAQGKCTCKKGVPSSDLEVKSLNHPDEQRTLPKTKIEVVQVGHYSIMRATFEPGWKWSECVKPTVGTRSCETSHVNYVLSGRMKIVMDNGAEKEVGPGDVMYIPSGHDAFVIGNEPCVAIDFIAGATYGKTN